MNNEKNNETRTDSSSMTNLDYTTIEKILINSPIITALHDKDLNMIWANKAYQEATGLSLEEIKGKKCYSVWNLSKPCNNCPVLVAAQTGKPYETELTPENQDHWPESQGYWLSKAAPIFDDNGQLIGVVENAISTTDQREKEKLVNFQAHILNEIRESIIATDLQGNITYWNKGAERNFGYTSDEVLGKNVVEITPTTMTVKQAEEILSKLRLGETWRGEFKLRRKDGSEFWGYVYDNPILNNKNELTGIVGISYDLTQIKEAEYALKHSSDLMNYIIEHNRSAVAVLDKNLNYIYVSKKYLDDYGIKEESIIGKNHYDIFHDIPQKWKEIHKKVLIGEIFSAEDDPYEREDGTVYWTRWECRPWHEADGSIGGIIIYNEITNRQKALENQLRFYNERLKLLTSITEQVIGKKPIDIAANKMLSEIVKAFKADAGVIRIIKGEKLQLLTKYNVPDDSVVAELPINFGIAHTILTTMSPQAIIDTQINETTKNITSYHANAFQFKSYAGAPLLVHNEAIGIIGIYVTNEMREITDEDLTHLQIVASHLAAAIHNEFLYKEVMSQKTELESEITARIKTEENLSEREKQLNMIAETTGAVFYRLRYSDMKYDYMHPAIEQLTGYSVEEITEMGFKPIVLAIEQAGGEEIDADKLELNRDKLKYQFHADYQIRKRNGDVRWISDQSNPWFSHDGNLLGSVGILNDITQRKITEKEVQRAREKAEELVAIKSNFFSNMSHELRTPLVGILGFSEILQDELSGDSELNEIAGFINVSGKRLLETLNLLLDSSKLEAGKVEVNIADANIVPILNDVYNLYFPIALKKGLSFNFKCEKDFILAKIDEILTRSILDNLVNNAIKFTNQGNVTIAIESNSRSVEINIIDTGIGIPEDKQDIIWEEFRQVSEGVNRSFEGSGLGLSISKHYADLMGGKISVESNIWKGSTFRLILPAVEKEIPHAHDDTQLSINIHRTEIMEIKIKPNILYVEDDKVSAEVLVYATKNLYEIDVAESGEDAIPMLQTKKYDAILMDINLRKGLDGVQVTKMIRQLPSYKKTPIIAITAYASTGDREEFLANGMDFYISKPYKKHEILKLLKEAIPEK